MGCDCCGPPAPSPKPDITPTAASTVETSSYQDHWRDGNDAKPLDTAAPGHGKPTQEEPDGPCPPGEFSDNKTENVTEAPDCCRGKVRPCCDMSCLDRLAMRECEMSAAAAPDPKSQPNSEQPLFEKCFYRC